ncbi:hypothetical protein M8818_000160 [Zalaria obscura]|uniref:Uncharacterized protein n=1 Tax=Zalaria obscura TaxID=2024903 RepID=A0ACC3SPB3_9PEZI
MPARGTCRKRKYGSYNRFPYMSAPCPPLRVPSQVVDPRSVCLLGGTYSSMQEQVGIFDIHDDPGSPSESEAPQQI